MRSSCVKEADYFPRAMEDFYEKAFTKKSTGKGK
jgi:hypothetical protein